MRHNVSLHFLFVVYLTLPFSMFTLLNKYRSQNTTLSPNYEDKVVDESHYKTQVSIINSYLI